MRPRKMVPSVSEGEAAAGAATGAFLNSGPRCCRAGLAAGMVVCCGVSCDGGALKAGGVLIGGAELEELTGVGVPGGAGLTGILGVAWLARSAGGKTGGRGLLARYSCGLRK